VSTYYIGDGNTRKGPFNANELTAQGVRAETLIWREGKAQWQPAGSLPELASLFAPSVPGAAPAGAPGIPHPQSPYGQPAVMPYASPPPFNPGDVNSKKILCGVLGIILGSLGVHKFILGYTAAGVIMLCVSVGVSVVSCGILFFPAWGIMHVIGLIEGIIYLTKSDEEFYHTYIVAKRPWF
jgi:TM2 domain-containing membrane protein YozV